MMLFDEKLYLADMYDDSYYPGFLVDKLKALLIQVTDFLEAGDRNIEDLQQKLDEVTLAINDLQDEFWDNDSDIETVARDSIAQTVMAILAHYGMDLDIEEALRERDW